MIDVNAGTLLGDEPAALAWLVQTVQAVLDMPCCIDSPNPVAIEAAQGKAGSVTWAASTNPQVAFDCSSGHPAFTDLSRKRCALGRTKGE